MKQLNMDSSKKLLAEVESLPEDTVLLDGAGVAWQKHDTGNDPSSMLRDMGRSAIVIAKQNFHREYPLIGWGNDKYA